MSSSAKNTFRLVEGVLDKGLPYVANYLAGKLATSLFITDYNGIIHFPVPDQKRISGEEYIDIPIGIKRKNYYYNELTKVLYYRVPYNRKNAYVIVNNCNAEAVFANIVILKEAELAIKCYFSKINRRKDVFGQSLKQYFFGTSIMDINDILKMSENEINPYEKYFALLIREESSIIDWQLIISDLLEYARSEYNNSLTVPSEDYLLILLPASYYNTSFSQKNYIGYLKEVTKPKFRLNISLGMGQPYSLINILSSFKEAQIAIILPHLMGKSNFMQRFSDLGLYYYIFSQEYEQVINYCLQRIGSLIENDYKTDGELFPTLRRLLDSCGNIKATADNLYIHVNTLYYRISRIEQILKIDLSKMETRVELYAAIKVWDTIIAMGYTHDFSDKELHLNPVYMEV